MRHSMWLPIFMLFLIAGCSGQPSESDIRDAVQTRIREQIQNAESQARALGGEDSVRMMHAFGTPAAADIAVKNVEIMESRELDNGDYQMRIRFDTTAGDQHKSSTSKIIMHDTDDGWHAEFQS